MLARSLLSPLAGRIVEGAFGLGALVAGAALERRGARESVALGLAAGGIAAVGRALLGEGASVILGPPATNSPAVVPAIYGSNSAALGNEITGVTSFLQTVVPPGVMLHSSYEAFINHGAEHTQRLQSIVPGIEVWWGITGDEGCGPHDANGVCTFGDLHAGNVTPTQLQTLRLGVGRAAVASGIPWLVWDCEPAWTHGEAGFNAAAAEAMIAGVRQLPNAPRQGLTTYPQPTVHGDYPWQAFASCDGFLPNIYWGPGIGAPSVDGPTAYAGAAHSIDVSKRVGLLGANELIIPYLLMHGCAVAELGWVADHYAQVACWTISAGDRMDANGAAFIESMCALDREGFKGVGRIARYQGIKGIEQNSKLDADTLAALGVAAP